MSPDRHQRLSDLVVEALDLHGDARHALLDHRCTGDADLRREVESLLLHEDVSKFLVEPCVSPDLWNGADDVAQERLDIERNGHPAAEDLAHAEDHEYRPEWIGPYRILERVGAGGMGVVFKAEQQNPRRLVALKVPRPGFTPHDALRRFTFETQALARLQHPGIAQIYEAGMASAPWGQQPYFAMEFVIGRPLTAYVREHDWPLRRRLELIIKVCEAVQHAHHKGVIHRDLKPANIFVDQHAQPKILDFGVAQVTDAGVPKLTGYTLRGQLVGTLAYMSPEQLTGDPCEVDVRSDVYALGVLLYELLTERHPYPIEHLSLPAAARLIADQPPRPLSSSDAALRGDLEKIAAKALEKDISQRYQSAIQLATDLQRFLQGERPLIAPPSPADQVRRFIRRHRVALAAAGAVVLAIAVGLVVSTRMYFLAEKRLSEIVRLADVNDLKSLLSQVQKVSAHPADVPLLEAWVAKAEELADRLPLHLRTLRALRADALPYTEAQRQDDARSHPQSAALDDLRRARTAKLAEPAAAQASAPAVTTASMQVELEQIDGRIAALERALAEHRTWRFADPAKQWQHDLLIGLVEEIERWTDPRPTFGTIAHTREQLEFARHVRRRSLETPRQQWVAAIAQIADPRRAPLYRGLRLEPQMGLVPIGVDPCSGLWEFAHLQTGDAPVRSPDGRIQITDRTGLVLVLIPGGTFRMGCNPPSAQEPLGSPNVDPFAHVNDWPVQSVTLDPFFLSKYEMTQAQWDRTEHANLATWPDGTIEIDQHFTALHPVESVSWYEADEVLARLGLCLPSEAQWEYAARAGTTTVWWTGDDAQSLAGAANISDVTFGRWRPPGEVHNAAFDDGFHRHAPVGQLRANAFGLHDVAGNVGEWCRDGCGPRWIPTRPEDGLRIGGPGGAGLRITRGGGFTGTACVARSTAVSSANPAYRNEALGLRPARRVLPKY